MKSKLFRKDIYPTRVKKRCPRCGRARRLTIFSLCQIHVRELSNEMQIPGVYKSKR